MRTLLNEINFSQSAELTPHINTSAKQNIMLFLVCLVVGLAFAPIFSCKIRLKPVGTKLATIRSPCDELASNKHESEFKTSLLILV